MSLIAAFFILLILRIMLQLGVFGSTHHLKATVKTKAIEIQNGIKNDIQLSQDKAAAERKKLDELKQPKVPKSVGNTIKDIFKD